MIRPEIWLKRYPKNPIIIPKDFPYGNCEAIFNPGQTMMGEKTILLLSVQLANERSPYVHVAESLDGVNFTIHEEPLFHGRMEGGIIGDMDMHPIDCRVTYFPEEKCYYIIRPGSSDYGTVAFLYRTVDFRSAEFIDIVAMPFNRVPCLFPEKIGGLYWRLDRPVPPGQRGGIWTSNSPNLTHWGHHRILQKGFNNWSGSKIGPTPPIKTEKGWLEIFHGVSYEKVYSLGAMLLNLENPEHILGRMNSYLMTPDEPYEISGRVPNVVFTAGAIADLQSRQLRIYYGASDSCIGLAVGDLDAIIDACLEGK